MWPHLESMDSCNSNRYKAVVRVHLHSFYNFLTGIITQVLLVDSSWWSGFGCLVFFLTRIEGRMSLPFLRSFSDLAIEYEYEAKRKCMHNIYIYPQHLAPLFIYSKILSPCVSQSSTWWLQASKPSPMFVGSCWFYRFEKTCYLGDSLCGINCIVVWLFPSRSGLGANGHPSLWWSPNMLSWVPWWMGYGCALPHLSSLNTNRFQTFCKCQRLYHFIPLGFVQKYGEKVISTRNYV